MIKRMILIAILMLSTSLYAEENKTVRVDANNSIINQELQKAMEMEKKFAKEQTFYNADNYDFKGSEVNKDSLKNIPIIEIDDPSLDSQTMLGME